jgi:anti-sigma B factor antagonist
MVHDSRVTSSDLPVPDNVAGQAVSVTVDRFGDMVVLAVSGEVDMLTAPQVKAAVVSVLAGSPPVMVIDLLAVSFLGSAGLAVLVEAAQTAGERTRLRVVAAGSATLRPLQATGLDQSLTVYSTRDDALANP